MKMAVFLGGLALVLAGCSSYQGGTGNEYETTYGTAAEMRSPGGLDRARSVPATNYFDEMPEMQPVGPGPGVTPE